MVEVRTLPDQVFLELCENAALRGERAMDILEEIGCNMSEFYRRRGRLGFDRKFLKKHGRKPFLGMQCIIPDKVSEMTKQEFIEFNEKFTLEGKSISQMSKTLNVTRDRFISRRHRVRFTTWFLIKHGKTPREYLQEKRKVKKVEKAVEKKVQNAKLKTEMPKLDFHSALQKKMNDPNFLDAVHKKIAAKTLGITT